MSTTAVERRNRGGRWLAYGLVGMLSTAAGAVTFLIVVALDEPQYLAAVPLVTVALAGGFLLISNTLWGICFTAFAIGPFGIIEVELAGITVNLPEIMILALFAKEALFFVFQKERLEKISPLFPLIPFALAAAIGMRTGKNYGNGIVRILQDCRQFTEYAALYMLVCACIKERRHVRRVLWWYVAGGSLLAVHGILQRFTNIGIPLQQVLSDAVFHGATRSGSFYGATPLGGLMVLTIGGIAGLMLSSPSRLARFGLVFLGIACTTATVFTNTRASWIALFIALVFIFLSVRKSPRLVIFTVMAATLFSVTLGPLVVHRMAKIEFSEAERSLLERVDYYTVAWYIFRDYPMRGLGWGCRFKTEDILTNEEYRPTKKPGEIIKTFSSEESTVHSAYLQLLVRTGLIGLAGFGAFLAYWFLVVLRERGWRRGSPDDVNHNLFVALAGAIIGYLCHCGLENFFQWPVMAQSFWMFVGLTFVVAKLVREEQAAPASEPADAEEEA